MLWVAMMAARPEARTSCVSAREHVVGGVRVEIAGRLVGQQDARRIGDRARDRDALLLAAGEFRRPVRRAARSGRDRSAARPRAWLRLRARQAADHLRQHTFSSAENSGSR